MADSVSLAASTANATDQNLSTSLQKTMGKEDFLKLLVTQLRFQDPMSPDDL